MDDRELERFCAEAYPALVAALTHQFGDRWLAEELAQDALVRTCDHWGRVSGLDSPIGWAFRAGVNLGNSWFRRRSAERRAHQRHGPDQAFHDDPDGVDRLAVSEALQGLTRAQRETLVLRFYLGLAPEEVAELTGSTAGAVRGLTHRAIKTLRNDFGVALKTEEAADAP